jgi:hypothetical protein
MACVNTRSRNVFSKNIMYFHFLSTDKQNRKDTRDLPLNYISFIRNKKYELTFVLVFIFTRAVSFSLWCEFKSELHINVGWPFDVIFY